MIATKYYDCDDDDAFYYLSRFNIKSGVIIGKFQAEFTRIPQDCSCYETAVIARNR